MSEQTKTAAADPRVFAENENARAWFIAFLRYGLGLSPRFPNEKMNGDERRGVYYLGKMHGISAMTAKAVTDSGHATEKSLAAWKSCVDEATARFARSETALVRLADTMEKNGIPYVPLKGAVVRGLYPSPWRRESTDLDVLVHEADVERASELLQSACGYTFARREYHNLVLTIAGGVCLELHFSLRETMEAPDKVLDTVWEHTRRVGDTYEYAMTPSFFLFHHMAHMAYHMSHGGIGVKAFVDLKLIREKTAIDENEVLALCEKAGIRHFYEVCVGLCDVWFSETEKKADDETAALAAFVLGCGAFGQKETQAAARRGNDSGTGHFLKRVFVGRDVLEQIYPKLRQYPFLLPYYSAKRIADAVFVRKRAGKFAEELRLGAETSDIAARENALMKQLELR